jgi:hypothetical protein
MKVAVVVAGWLGGIARIVSGIRAPGHRSEMFGS